MICISGNFLLSCPDDYCLFDLDFVHFRVRLTVMFAMQFSPNFVSPRSPPPIPDARWLHYFLIIQHAF